MPSLCAKAERDERHPHAVPWLTEAAHETAMSASRPKPDEDEEKSYELGDLELAPRRPRPSHQELSHVAADDPLAALTRAPSNDFEFDSLQRGHQIVQPRPSGVLPGVPLMDGEFDDSTGGPELELDADPPKKAPVRASMARPVDDAAPSSQRPSNRVTRSGRPLEDERRARELAAYGVAEGGIDPARYVIHVAQRMFALWRARQPIERQASALADAYEDALKDLGRALLDDPAVRAHEGLTERVVLVKTRQGELEKAQADTAALLERETGAAAELDRQVGELKAALAPFEQTERDAEAVVAKADAALKRQKARLQRAEIELRALTKASVPPPAERLQSISGEREQQQRDLDGLQAALHEATSALGRARRELALRRGALDEMERKRRQQESATRAHVNGHAADVARAEHALSAVLVSLAEAADAVGLAHGAREQVLNLRASEQALDEVVDQLAMYDRALRIYDREAVTTGAAMWLGLLCALVLLVYLL